MLSTFICGSGTIHNEEHGDDQPCTTTKRSKKNSFCRRHSSKDNPYSTRGLDKFSALVADLEEKRQRIYSQFGSEEDAPLVRFVYSSSNDCVPIVVKLKDKKGMEKTKKSAHDNSKENQRSSEKVETELSQEVKREQGMEPNNKKDKRRSLSWKVVLRQVRRPEYYFPAAVILILVFLAVFGRSAAVLCTSLGWYLIPTLQGQSSKSMKKKEYTRRPSEKKMIIKSAGPSPPRKGTSSKHLGHWKSFS